jgi:sugar phosphate isomerase/epimerase
VQNLYPRISLNGLYDREGPIAADLALCHAIGVGWLGLPNWKFTQLGVAESIRIINADSTAISTICHPNLFSLDDRECWPAQLASAKRTVDIAVEVDAASVYLTTGSRGTLSWPDAADAFVDGVAELVGYAASQGMSLLVEPTASFMADVSILHTLGDVVEVSRRTGVGVCLDVFACWADSTFASALDAAAARCGLVQVSDLVEGDRHARERGVPGDGVIGWDPLFAALGAAGYAGLFDLELVGPRIDREGPAAAFGRAAQWLDAKLRAHGLEDGSGSA